VDFADWIGNKMEAAAKRGAEALGLMAVAAVGVGLKTAASMQQSRMALDTFTGSAQAGGQAFKALQALVGPASFAQLTQGFTALSLAGGSPQSNIAMMTSLSNVASQMQQPGQAFDALSQAVNRIQETGQLEARSMLAFISNGVDVYGMLSKELGVSNAEVKKTLAGGANITAPAGFLADLQTSGMTGRFADGLKKYRATLGGEMDAIKVEGSEALAVMVTPITDLVSREGPKVTVWLTDTKDRFTSLGKALGSEWQAGDTSGFSKTLATILGNPDLAKYIDPMAKSIQGLGQIITHDLVPAAKTMLAVAVPAFQAFSDVLGFLGKNKGVVEAILAALAGAKVASLGAGLLSFLGIGGVLAAGGGGAAAGGAAGALSGGTLPAALIAGGLTASYQSAKHPGSGGGSFGDAMKPILGGALAGAGIGKFVPVIGPLLGGLLGAGVGSIQDIFTGISHEMKGQGGGSPTSQTIIFHPNSIQVNGAGDPKAVADNVAGSIADQMARVAQSNAERGASGNNWGAWRPPGRTGP
jgi:hypothetical protein